MGKVIIINRYILKLGGIEKKICSLIPFLLDNGVRVIWIRQRENAIGDSFASILQDKRLEYVYVKNPNVQWFNHEDFKLKSDDQIIILSFNPSSFAKSLTLCKEFPNADITPFYYVPDTTGPQYFRERYFPGVFRKYLEKKLSRLYQKWDSFNLIRFFSRLQIDALESAYGFKIQTPEKKLFEKIKDAPPFDYQGTLLRAEERNKYFNIITVGRFDFPHKGYILGLIRAYGRLKNKYKMLHLTIVGYGPHEDRVRDEIAKLPEDAKSDITLVGETPPDELFKLYARSHLNIAVASAVGHGVINSVISIPARNYCEGECEVYGLHYEPQIVVSTAPGHLVDDDIIRVIEMNNDEYCQETKRMHDLFDKNIKTNPWYVFDTLSLCERKMRIKREDILVLKYIEQTRKILTVYHYILLKVFVNRKITFTQVVEKGRCPMGILISFMAMAILSFVLFVLLIISFL